MKPDFARLGELIHSDRDRLGLSQTEYAAKLGLSQRQISELERGVVRRLSARVADAIRAQGIEIPEATEEIGSVGSLLRSVSGAYTASRRRQAVSPPRKRVEAALAAVELIEAILTGLTKEEIKPTVEKLVRRSSALVE